MQYTTTEIINTSSLFWSGSEFKEKGSWDPGTCLSGGTFLDTTHDKMRRSPT